MPQSLRALDFFLCFFFFFVFAGAVPSPANAVSWRTWVAQIADVEEEVVESLQELAHIEGQLVHHRRFHRRQRVDHLAETPPEPRLSRHTGNATPD